jgi:hypothetical protein
MFLYSFVNLFSGLYTGGCAGQHGLLALLAHQRTAQPPVYKPENKLTNEYRNIINETYSTLRCLE